MSEMKSHSGKIAFIFPAKFNLDGARSPTLNFKVRDDGIIAMSMGISFLELNADSNYFVFLKLYNPNDEDVSISSSVDALPSDYIDPIKGSSFLTASFHFKPIMSGSYRFRCELLDLLNAETPADTMDVLFNVLMDDYDD